MKILSKSDKNGNIWSSILIIDHLAFLQHVQLCLIHPTAELLKQFNLERKYFANTLRFFFIIVYSLGSTEVYIGYDVDTTVTNYRLRTLSGQLQSYENFFSYNMNSATWHCVSMYSSAWFAEKCDEDYHFLCSNLSNILGTFLKDYINTMILFIYIYILLW